MRVRGCTLPEGALWWRESFDRGYGWKRMSCSRCSSLDIADFPDLKEGGGKESALRPAVRALS
jgi:hypothetical protein